MITRGLRRFGIAGLLAAAALLWRAPVRAATINGSDYGGANLVPANGDVLKGTFTNVGLFEIGPGTTAFVSQGDALAVYAATISIRGVLDGSGSGAAGRSGGQTSSAGSDGVGGGPSDSGGGSGALAGKGGGGGGGGGAGGNGGGPGGGAGGGAYGSTGTVTNPLSSDDAFLGSGGGGGGGGNSTPGGAGADGGASIYLEAASMTVTGTGAILASGADAADVTVAAAGTFPGAGGGGGGGTVLIRLPGSLTLMSGASVQADGGDGGDLVHNFGLASDPGGGGGGGRIKIFYGTAAPFHASFSTAAGAAGGVPLTGFLEAPAPQAGAVGAVSFGAIASSPTGFGIAAVHVSSVAWNWSGAVAWGDAPSASRGFRVYPSSASAPLPPPHATAGSAVATATETALTPNTTVQRFVTTFTDWGDSLPSVVLSTHTLAAEPAAGSPVFSGMGDASLTVNWTSGSPANPAYTVYEVVRSTHSDFSAAVSTSYVIGVSSSPSGLSSNTTYHFRVRAVNADNIPTAFTTTLSTASLSSAPGSPAFDGVHVTSVAFSWSASGNPAGTLYRAEVSSDNFFTITDSSLTLLTGTTFFNLSPGTQYFFRALAQNRNEVDSSYSATASTTSGLLSDSSQPPAPAAPDADRRYSYDGDATFSWPASQSSVGILDYFLEIGTTLGGSDFFSGNVGNVLTYSASGLASGRTYYARVRARSNAGVNSDFSQASDGVTVYRPSQESHLSTPINWPNPFDPAQGATQIGFFLEEPATVTLKLYTLQGGAVHEVSREVSSAGNQVWTWNGRNDGGRVVAPGGYIAMIQMRYAGRTVVRKLKIAVVY